MWTGDQGSALITKRSAPAPPVRVSLAWLAIRVSAPVPPVSTEAVWVAVSVGPAAPPVAGGVTTGGVGVVGVVGSVGRVAGGVIEPEPEAAPDSLAQVRSFGETCSRSTMVFGQ